MKKFKLKIAAGTVGAVALVAMMTPFNIGGCSEAVQSISNVTNVIPGGGGGGGGAVERGFAMGQGAQQVGHGLTLSDSEERGMGECVALAATQRFRVVRNDALNTYVTMVAQVIADATPSGGKPVAFVLDSNQLNAYSGPAGYVMITKGLLLQLGDESELAGVIGHEMGHIVERHGLDSAQKSEVFTGVVKIGAAAVGQNGGFVALGGALTGFVFGSAYSQGQENEADRDSVAFTISAGYDPQGYVRALQKLQTSGTTAGSAGFSHPGIGQRLQNVQSEITRRRITTGQTNRDRFMAAISGVR